MWQKEAKEVAELREFSYKGFDVRGNKTSGTITAMSRSEARFMLERDGNSELEINNKKNWYDIEFGRAVPLEVLLQITRQLASFSEAGIPAAKGISILTQTADDKKMREILEEILIDIESGSRLSDAVKQYPTVFPRYYSAILSSAERSGNLTEALSTLNSYLERDLRSKRAVRRALRTKFSPLFH